MNQKQRDYLIKRLEGIKQEKLATKLPDPNFKPFIKKIKYIPSAKILDLVSSEIEKKVKNINNYKSSNYDYKRKEFIEGEVTRLSYDASYFSFTLDELTNILEVDAEYRDYVKKYYAGEEQRKQHIELKFQQLCDKIVFAESYDEALKLIQEFVNY